MLIVPPYFGFSADAAGAGVGLGAGVGDGAGNGAGDGVGAGVGTAGDFGPQETKRSAAIISTLTSDKTTLLFIHLPYFI